jgi:ribosomal-protein-alanine N-acetyltransferase
MRKSLKGWTGKGDMTDMSDMTGMSDMTSMSDMTGIDDIANMGDMTGMDDIAGKDNAAGIDDAEGNGNTEGKGNTADMGDIAGMVDTADIDDTAGMGDAEGMDDLTGMDGIEIIPALAEHIDDIMAIERASFRTPWSRESFLQEISNKDLSAYFAAASGGTIVGYAGMTVMAGEGHIMNIAVHPEYRRKGIGQLLLERLVRHAWEKGIPALTLEVGVTNVAAIELYKKNGFHIYGLRKRYYGNEDAYIMWLFRNDNENNRFKGDG